MGRLQDRVAIVTGGGSGLGKAQALRFAQEGAAVVVADIDAVRAEEVADQIRTAGGRSHAVKVDVTDESAVQNMVAEAVSEFGTVNILSNTAGRFDGFKQVLETTREEWDGVLAANLTSLYLVSNAVLPVMIKGGGGAIVNIASGAGLRGGGGGAAYTSTKHAVVGFTRQLAAGYGHQGVRVNAIAPGLIDTPMVADFSKTEESKATLDSYPGKRLGKPEDIAAAAAFLVSDDADYIHAATLPVDGGMVDTFGAHLSVD